MPLNVNISNYNLGRLNCRTLKYAASFYVQFAHHLHIVIIHILNPKDVAVLVQARIQLLAKGEVVKIMENNFFLPQAANVTDRMPRKRVPQL